MKQALRFTPDVVADVYYGLAWADDSQTIFYVRPDTAMTGIVSPAFFLEKMNRAANVNDGCDVSRPC